MSGFNILDSLATVAPPESAITGGQDGISILWIIFAVIIIHLAIIIYYMMPDSSRSTYLSESLPSITTESQFE